MRSRNKATRFPCLASIAMAAVICCLFALLSPIRSYAEDDGRAYLHFYTVDGEEIEDLEKKKSPKKEYTFEDPNEYKYLPAEEGDDLVYPELYYQVTGIAWKEVDDDGKNIGEYKKGDSATFKAGDHFFYVITDNPLLTGENTLNASASDMVHLYFYNVNGDEIYSLQQDMSKDDKYKFPDPSSYAYWFEETDDPDEDTGEEIESEDYSGKGIYWWCEDESGKQYLFENNQEVKFKPGEYNIYPRTDDPVTIIFHYPIEYDGDYSVDASPGEEYGRRTGKVGDTIPLMKSLGAIIFGDSFQGWEDEYTGETYKGGASYKVMNNGDINLYAIYEHDDNWNPDEADQNMTAEEWAEQKKEKVEFFVDEAVVNEKAGAGYRAYIDPTTGVLKRTGGNVRVNSETPILGIPGQIKKQSIFSAMVDPNGDPADPDNYKYDKYGRKMEDSNLDPEINNVLRQDDSAMYMDVYGNSFVYLPSLTRENNMALALERLNEGKTDSWVQNVSSWDTEVIKCFEAVEFALIYGKYPQEGQELVEGVTWKNSYMSKKAFNKLLPYKKMWQGWLDNYYDGLEEKYRNGGSTVVGDSGFKNPFMITAYAGQGENSLGVSEQIGSRVNMSQDFKDVVFKPQYYVPNRTYSGLSYSFASLDGLDSEAISVLTKVFNKLTDYGYTEEAAAGACGNLWQECTFNYKIDGGLVQWMGGRQTALKAFALSKGKAWTDLDVQLDFMIKELDESYAKMINSALKKITGGNKTMSTIDDVTAASDAWCYAMEGCICWNSAGGKWNCAHGADHPNSKCAEILGASYQDADLRRQYAEKVLSAMTAGVGVIGGDFAGMSASEIWASIFPNVPKPSVIGTYISESQMKSQYIVSIPVAGTSRKISVNKYIAESAQAAFEELAMNGFQYCNGEVSGFNWRGIARNGGYLSVADHASFHASGLAIDINWSHNPQFPGKPGIETIRASYKPKTDVYAVGLAEYYAFKRNGLLWGRDFSSWYDIMHMSLGEVTQDGRNAWISEQTELAR